MSRAVVGEPGCHEWVGGQAAGRGSGRQARHPALCAHRTLVQRRAIYLPHHGLDTRGGGGRGGGGFRAEKRMFLPLDKSAHGTDPRFVRHTYEPVEGKGNLVWILLYRAC